MYRRGMKPYGMLPGVWSCPKVVRNRPVPIMLLHWRCWAELQDAGQATTGGLLPSLCSKYDSPAVVFGRCLVLGALTATVFNRWTTLAVVYAVMYTRYIVYWCGNGGTVVLFWSGNVIISLNFSCLLIAYVLKGSNARYSYELQRTC